MNPRARRLGAAIALLVAASATIATSPAREYASTKYEEQIRLTADGPAVARYFDVAITNRDTVEYMNIAARAYSERLEDGMRIQDFTPGVVVNIVADPPTLLVHEDAATFGPVSPQNPILSLLDLCRTTCTQGIWVLTRMSDPNSPALEDGVTTTLEVTLSASGNVGSEPLDMDMTLQHVAARDTAATPTSRETKAEGRIVVSATSPSAARSMTITLRTDELSGPLAYPLVAQVSLGGRPVGWKGEDFAHYTHFSLSSDYLQPEADSPYSYVAVWGDPPAILNLLPLCQAGALCQIHVTLESEYEPSANVPEFDDKGTPIPDGFVELSWMISAQLVDFQGRPLPDDLISISVDK